ncbi:type VI secretion system lipoprotein TssJ [Salmonella enterica subsp. enterica serovar 9,12:-:1,5]|nr:type VI secretion system lipoprotein TssJ [Salmonella enterica subsp. enterica serovar 9,12:-:1,5]
MPFALLLLSGCGSSDALPDLESQRLDLSVKASDKVNPDNQKKAAPIEIRVYELKNDAAFTTADYWSLHDNDKSVLTDDLVRRDSFILRPGEEKKLRRPLNAQTTAIGVLAGYLLLQILNRFEPLLIHLAKTPLAPEVLYRYLSELAGELSTYVRPQTRRPAEYKEYKHLTPYAGLKSLVDEVQFLLNAVLIRGAQRIELKEGTYGILNAVVAPSDLADFSTLVLAIKASMPTDVLLQHFAAQTKIGPSDRLPELIRSHLPGLALQVLPVPPRQIPFQAGYIYYDIRREGALWEHIARYGGMAMHTAGEFPGLETELWGVRDK